MKVSTDLKKINELLTRGVDKLYPSREALEKVLRSGKRIRLYLGIDPTGPELHLGHTVPLRKLRQFQELGHEVILLIGSFTAMIGDPTGKGETRKPLMREAVMKNAQTYQEQAAKILRFDGGNPVTLRFNHEWHDALSQRDFLGIAFHVTGPQLLLRDIFARRLKEGKTFTLAEFIYPLLQGYDSVAMDVDLEVGATDQTFNMLVGRDLMKSLKGKEKFVLTVPLLTDASGNKIGKTEGNVIGITDQPEDLYGKLMALPDDATASVFELCTDVPMEEVRKMSQATKKGANPRDFKAQLARTIVEMYHGAKAARVAEAQFVKLFQKHELPEAMPEVRVKKKKWNMVDLLVHTKLAPSKSEARRLIEQGGIKLDGHTLEGTDVLVTIAAEGHVLQRGKRQFVRIKRG